MVLLVAVLPGVGQPLLHQADGLVDLVLPGTNPAVPVNLQVVLQDPVAVLIVEVVTGGTATAANHHPVQDQAALILQADAAQAGGIAPLVPASRPPLKAAPMPQFPFVPAAGTLIMLPALADRAQQAVDQLLQAEEQLPPALVRPDLIG